MSNQVESDTCPNCGQACRRYPPENTLDCLECGFYSEIHPVGNYRTLNELNEERKCNNLHELNELPEQNFLL